LAGGYGHVNRQAVDVQENLDRNTGNGSATTVIPLYTGGRLTGNVRLRTAEQRQAIGDYARLALQALNEVEDALNAEQVLAAREALLQEAADDSRRAAGLTETSFRVGKSDMRDVMNRNLAANAAEVALLAVRRERLARRVDLHLALGGDFVQGADTTSTPPASTGQQQ